MIVSRIEIIGILVYLIDFDPVGRPGEWLVSSTLLDDTVSQIT